MQYVAPSGQTPRPLKPLISERATILLVLGGLLLCCLWPLVLTLRFPEAFKTAMAWVKIGTAFVIWLLGVAALRQKKGGWALTAFGCGLLLLVSGAMEQAYLNIIAPLANNVWLEEIDDIVISIDEASDVLFYVGVGLLNFMFLLQLLGDLRAQRLPAKEKYRLLLPLGWLVLAGLHLVRGLDDVFIVGQLFWSF